MLGKSTAFSENNMLRCRGKLLDLNEPRIMGILNLTPDSFFDGGKNLNNDYYLLKADELVSNGAAILDVGAATTKPGSKLIDPELEWSILKKPLEILKKRFPDMLFSVDTYHALTVQRVADLGVEIINDISGGTIDGEMFKVVGKNKLAYVLMHIYGLPETMQQNPVKGNVVDVVERFFEQQLELLHQNKVDSILLDPGFGFGKTIEQNFTLLREMEHFSKFPYPLLVGVSRKSMIFRFLETNPQQALNGTSVLNTFALQNGAKVLRVHDAREANETIRLFLKYKQS